MFNNKIYIAKITSIIIIASIIILIIPISYIQICNAEKELNIFLNNVITQNGKYYDENYLDLKENFENEISIEFIDNMKNISKFYSYAEVINAQKYGYGKSLRFSKKDNKVYIFIAKEYDKYIIDVSKQLKIIDYNVPGTIFILIITVFLMIYFILYITKVISKRIIYNFCNVTNNICEHVDYFFKDDINAVSIRNTVKEFIPNIKKLEIVLKEQKIYLDYLKKKYKSIKKILSSMKEGIIILDKNYTVLLSNKEALKVFDLKDISNKNFIHIYRSEKFLNALKEIKKNDKSIIFDIEKKNKEVYRVRIIPADDGCYTIFTKDVTHVLKLEKIRSEFNSNVSHELKTPITTISGFAELLSKGMVKDNDKVIDYSKKIFLESKRLINLIDDMLKLSEIESCSFTEEESVSILDVLNNVLEMYEEDIKIKKISINIEGNAVVKIKYSHVLELISNLISNAIKYNKEGGIIDIKINSRKNYTKISIKDTGIGIPKEDLDRIFERFYRVDKGRNNKIPGTGIGLSIVKHIVELYKGTIKVKNTNNGSEFIIYLNKY